MVRFFYIEAQKRNPVTQSNVHIQTSTLQVVIFFIVAKTFVFCNHFPLKDFYLTSNWVCHVSSRQLPYLVLFLIAQNKALTPYLTGNIETMSAARTGKAR